MAKSFHYVQIGKQKLKLTNLSKVIYPEAQIVKAEIIEYYLKIAPILLNHLKYRPLSLIRYPDGIQAHQFFQKDRPDWAPEWIKSVLIGKNDPKDYMYLTDEASVVWLANLACLELHIMQITHFELDKPDHFIFDLDPSVGTSFKNVKELAFLIREHLLQFNYHPFIKTSGGKGFHIFVPIDAKWDHKTVFEATQEVAKAMVQKYPGLATLKMKKEARGDKILVDIYRNRASQTVVAPYSMRGKPGAPISMPITWEELEEIESAQAYTIRNVFEVLAERDDIWEGFASYSSPLHTTQKTFTAPKSMDPNPHYKTPGQLEKYAAKRDFEATPEPSPEVVAGSNNQFVVHRHHATRLHYDLRLEKDGVLLSWAVPRGMPPRPGIKRLAVQTEDHPMKYLTFEGEIPKGEYGGGKMWMFYTGKYQITKEKKDGFYFKLSSPQVTGEYRMHNTKAKEWLLERVDNPKFDIQSKKMDFMLADISKKVPAGNLYKYEVKWDGIRTQIVVDEAEIKIYSRSGRDLSSQFPELIEARSSLNVSCAIYDAEVVSLDPQGRPIFKKVIGRMHQKSETKILSMSKSNPVACYIFDCMYMDGRTLINEPWHRRHEWMSDSIRKGSPFRPSEAIEDGNALYEAARKMQLEGIMAKQIKAKYQVGKRSKDWLKIKFRNTADCVIVGYKEGQGQRSVLFGALHIMENRDSKLIYRGKVGTGFDDKRMKEILEAITPHVVEKKTFDDKTEDDKISTWCSPKVYCEIEYASITDNQTFREPVFVRLRPDLNA